jgi:hypothetical protein
VAEKAAHRTAAGLGRMIGRELHLLAVMATGAQGIHFIFLFAGIEHVVELLVVDIVGQFLGFFFPGDGNEKSENGKNNGYEHPVTLLKFHVNSPLLRFRG